MLEQRKTVRSPPLLRRKKQQRQSDGLTIDTISNHTEVLEERRERKMGVKLSPGKGDG